MTIQYTNRLGTTVYLHERTTKNGRRFAFAKSLDPDDAIDEIPDGYEIHESVHGTVTLRRPPRKHVTDLEQRTVQRVLSSTDYLKRCRYEVKAKIIEFFEPRQSPYLGRYRPDLVTYEAVMRFELTDAKTRVFRADRMCYRSWVDGWMEIGRGPLTNIASDYLPHLTRASFFDLWEGEPSPDVGPPGTRL
jgi:hypothetical protein